ncbi:two-component system response regulator LnrK [soil metagenome]
MIRLLIVHEVRLMADLTANVLRMQPDLKVIACVSTADTALTLLKKSPCDLILVSVTLPHNGAAMLTAAVTKMDRSIKILITGLVETKTVILRWLEAGAAGYVHADESLATLLHKIRRAAQGECLLSPVIAAALLARVGELKQQISQLNGWQTLNTDELYSELTVRECEVLDLIEQRYSNQRIGNALYIELGTVKNHVHNIMAKLGVRNRQQAAIVARQALANATVPINM